MKAPANTDPTALGSLAQALYSVSDACLRRALTLCQQDPSMLLGEALVKMDALSWVERRVLLQKQSDIRTGHASFEDVTRMTCFAARKAETIGDRIRTFWDTLEDP